MSTRLRILQDILGQLSAGLAVVFTPPNLTYLLNRPLPQTYERPLVLASSSRGKSLLLAPRLEEPRFKGLEVATVFYGDGEDPLGKLDTIIETGGVGDGVVLEHSIPHGLYQRVLKALGNPVDKGPLEPHIMRRRRVKTREEVARIRRAVALVEDVMKKAERLLQEGVSEVEVSLELVKHALSRGADAVAFSAVASGANSAIPHHERGPRVLKRGDVVVVDVVVSLEGYHGDLTRVFVLGDPPEGFEKAFRAVVRAREAAFKAASPGVEAGMVDEAVWRVLVREGFADAILHRTGHGLGVEVHEPPFIARGNREVLEEGNVFTVEPGLYFEKRFGVRLESVVVVSEKEGVVLLDTWGLESPLYL